MIKSKSSPRIFFGWWTALASGVLAFLGLGFGNFGFSALFKPIASELGFSRAATSVAASIGSFERGFLSPVAGWLADKFGPRWIVLSGILIVGLSLILMNSVNSLWAFYLVWGILLGMGANASFSIPLDKAIMNWFIKKRGRAVSFISASTALAAVTMLPIVAWLVSTQGWRMTCVIAGVVIWIIGLPVAWFFIRQHRPEYYGLLPDGVTTEDPMETTQMIDKALKYATEVEEMEFTLRQAMKTPAYWLLIVATAGLHLVGQVLIIHAVPFVTDMGVEPVKAAVMIGIMTAGNIPGTFIGGFLADHIKKQHLRFLVGGTYLLQIIGFSAFLLNRTLAMAYLIFILHHFSMGICSPLSRVMPANYFGRKAFGSIRGTSTMFTLPVLVAGPVYAGWVYDTTGSYITVFILCAVLLIPSAIVMSLASPPKSPTQVTDIYKIV